jgi:hypothetical protein
MLIGPDAARFKSRLLEQVHKPLSRVLVTILGMHPLAFGKAPFAAAPSHRQIAPGFQVHLDPMLFAIEKSAMLPIPHIEIGLQQAVQMQQ